MTFTKFIRILRLILTLTKKLMTEETFWTALLAAVLTIVATPIQYVIITLFLLLSDNVLYGWILFNETKGTLNKKISTAFCESSYNVVKHLGVLFFVLLSATVFSKYDANLSFVELIVYTSVGFWLLSSIYKKGNVILETEIFKNIINKIKDHPKMSNK